MQGEAILKNEEKAVFALRSIYRQFGYLPYKMGKFEEYDFYVKNKDFLISDSVITFNDTNGKLMALKPDVTLSIIKNYKDEPGIVNRVYYNENVYRVSESTHAYKEIMQTGLECFGEIGIQNKLEVLHLAVESLAAISGEFVLEISHMGILSGLLMMAGGSADFNDAVTTCIGEKNAHEIPRICKEFGVSDEVCNKLVKFVGIYGDRNKVIGDLETLFAGCDCGDAKSVIESAIRELKTITLAVENSPFKDKIIFDFSIVSSMKYYNGIVFRGFISGIPESVLSGGQYDKLMKKMGRNGGAIGFAVYLDLLETLTRKQNTYDVDVVLLYDDNDNMGRLIGAVMGLNAEGKTVSLQKNKPENISYKELMKLTDEGVETVG